MASPTAILGLVAKVFGWLFKLAGPLAIYFAGKKAQEHKNLQEVHKRAGEAAKISDGVSRASDDELDNILRD